MMVHCSNPTCAHRAEMHTMHVAEVRQVLENQGWLITNDEQLCPRCHQEAK